MLNGLLQSLHLYKVSMFLIQKPFQTSVMEDCGDDHMIKKATEWFNKCQDFAVQARIKGGPSLVDYEEMLLSLKDHHKKLVSEDRYQPAITHKKDDAKPVVPQIVAAVNDLTKTVEQVGFADRGGGGGSSSGGGRSTDSGNGNNERHKNVQCHECKKHGHIAQNCPDNDKKPSGDGDQQQQQGSGLPSSWHFMPNNKQTCGDKFPIKDGKSHTGKGKQMLWCAKCPGKNAAAAKGQ